MTINWKNTTENLGITLMSVLFGVFIGYFISVRASRSVINELTPLIEKAIDKESIKNEIKNEIRIDKIKKTDSLTIILSPNNRQDPTNVIITQPRDRIKEKRTWVGKLLSGKKHKN